MDLNRTVNYRSYNLNTISYDAVSGDMVGCEITTAEFDTPGMGYDEKRALSDGFDAADVWLGKRMVALTGVLYGRTRAEVYEKYIVLNDRLNPSDAFEASRGTMGFYPLDFWIPVPVSTTHPTGLIHMMVMARPINLMRVRFGSDMHGGKDNQALAIPWSAVLECKDPRIYSYDLTRIALHASRSGSGIITNVGLRPAPLFLRLYTDAAMYATSQTTPNTFWFHLKKMDNVTFISQFNIKMPKHSGWQVFEYDSKDRILRRRASGYNLPRMELLTFTQGTHPLVPPGQTRFAWAVSTSTLKPTVKLTESSVMDFRSVW